MRRAARRVPPAARAQHARHQPVGSPGRAVGGERDLVRSSAAGGSRPGVGVGVADAGAPRSRPAKRSRQRRSFSQAQRRRRLVCAGQARPRHPSRPPSSAGASARGPSQSNSRRRCSRRAPCSDEKKLATRAPRDTGDACTLVLGVNTMSPAGNDGRSPAKAPRRPGRRPRIRPGRTEEQRARQSVHAPAGGSGSPRRRHGCRSVGRAGVAVEHRREDVPRQRRREEGWRAAPGPCQHQRAQGWRGLACPARAAGCSCGDGLGAGVLRMAVFPGGASRRRRASRTSSGVSMARGSGAWVRTDAGGELHRARALPGT